MPFIGSAFLLLAFANASHAHPSGRTPPLALDASPDEIRRIVGAVRAGRKLTPRTWPNGARVSVAITFDIDNETLTRNQPLPVPLSQGEYGAVAALPRILAMLDRHNVPGTFFIPAVSAMLHPEMIPSIVRPGRHEVGVHGWIHENLPSLTEAAQEQKLMTQALDYMTKALGKRPVGFRAPSWAFSNHTLQQVLDAKFLYDGSFMAMDQPYELLMNGKPIGLVELPIKWILDDYPYFSATANGSMPSPDAAYQVYKAEFDGAYEERTLFVLTIHPHVIGHRSRLAQIDKLLTYIKSKPGVWFATLEDGARASTGDAAR